ncbi:GDP-L-fucose synthase family protein [Kiloniella antarctica]|uniref:GDP-L-fucose synthase n=1 Tax=Kiloniella antarctica TaxID=1550907 RepID=A0ABW5BQV7_9PROT
MTEQDTLTLSGKKIWVTGHTGMVGSAIVRRLLSEKCNILTVAHGSVDLTRQEEVENWIVDNKPDIVIVAAAKVGGIHANSKLPAEFLYNNLMIEANIIHASHRVGVEKLLFLGSSCIYPRNTSQPIKEEQLLAGPLEATNEYYALAKIAGIKLCQAYRAQYGDNFISIMPCNLYGPNDNFHPEYSHVPAGLLKRFHEAKLLNSPSVTVWGSGAPLREFLHVDAMSDASVFILKHYSGKGHLNVGCGQDISIADFADKIKRIVGYRGQITFDTTRPDGTLRKLLDISKLRNLGWETKVDLDTGIEAYYKWFLNNQNSIKQ